MSNLLDFVKNFPHVSYVDKSAPFIIVVNLKEDYVYADTGYRHKLFKSDQEALFGANIINVRKIIVKLVNGKIPANTICPFRKECPYSKEGGGCGHAGLDHSVEYSCGAARAFNLTNRG